MNNPAALFFPQAPQKCEFALYKTFIKNMGAVSVGLPTNVDEAGHSSAILDELADVLKRDKGPQISVELIESIKTEIFEQADKKQAPIFLKMGGMVLEPILKRLEKVRTCLFGIIISTNTRTKSASELFRCLDSFIKLDAVNERITHMTSGKDLSKFLDMIAAVKKQQKGCWEFIKYGFGDHDDVRKKVSKQLQAYRFS
jgi:hypothetical protein